MKQNLGGRHTKISLNMVPLVLLLGTLALMPSLVPVHATSDFTISASPSSFGNFLVAGSHHRSTITITSTGGFAGTVALTESDNGGITASFNPTSVTVSSGGSGTSTFTAVFGDCGQIGPSPITITGTSGSLQHSVSITYGPTLIC